MTQTIEIPEGFELKKVSDTEYKIVKKENVLPKTWEEFCKLNPIKYTERFISSSSCICGTGRNVKERDEEEDRNLIPSKEKAEAILALCQLIQLRDCYNDGWKPDWNSHGKEKYTIYYDTNHFEKTQSSFIGRVLVFKTEELRNEFFNNFKDLIEKLKPLYA